MKEYKKHITLFFLIFFISTKLISLHSLTHEEEDHHDDCEICEHIIALNTTPYTINARIIVEQLVHNNFKKQSFYEYSYQFVQNQIDKSLFCRPPPTA